MTVALILQARMSSKRLPGKILKEIEGKSILQHCIDRCERINGVDKYILAIPDDENSEIITCNTDLKGFSVFAGPEDNVLERYIGSQKSVGAKTTLRVTADCPVLDSFVCSKMLEYFQEHRFDYLANGSPRTFPHGFDCEIFKSALLEKFPPNPFDSYSREHVTPWIKTRNINKFNFTTAHLSLPYDFSKLRFVVDTADDLERLRRFFEGPGAACKLENFSIDTLLGQKNDWERHLSTASI